MKYTAQMRFKAYEVEKIPSEQRDKIARQRIWEELGNIVNMPIGRMALKPEDRFSRDMEDAERHTAEIICMPVGHWEYVKQVLTSAGMMNKHVHALMSEAIREIEEK